MQVARYIRAYHKQTETLAFEVLLPSDCLTFLSTVDFLQDDIDPLLYGVTELDADQTDFLHRHFFVDNIADSDYFDYFLECDSTTVKTKEEVDNYFADYLRINLECLICTITDELKPIIPAECLEYFKMYTYKVYQQGITDGRL